MTPTTAGDREAEIATTLIRLADTIVDGFDRYELLHDLSVSCARLLDADAAGVSIADGRRLQFVVATSEDMATVERFQADHRQGPCFDAYLTGQHVSTPDLRATARRWPRWTRQALALGFAAADAFPLRLGEQTVGALDVYATQTRTLSPDDVALGAAFAHMAAIGLVHEQAIAEHRNVQAQLQHALDNRISIEQAKGIVAERLQIPVSQAFDLIRRFSRSHNVKVVKTSRQIVNGELTFPPDQRPPATAEREGWC